MEIYMTALNLDKPIRVTNDDIIRLMGLDRFKKITAINPFIFTDIDTWKYTLGFIFMFILMIISACCVNMKTGEFEGVGIAFFVIYGIAHLIRMIIAITEAKTPRDMFDDAWIHALGLFVSIASICTLATFMLPASQNSLDLLFSVMFYMFLGGALAFRCSLYDNSRNLVHKALCTEKLRDSRSVYLNNDKTHQRIEINDLRAINCVTTLNFMVPEYVVESINQFISTLVPVDRYHRPTIHIYVTQYTNVVLYVVEAPHGEQYLIAMTEKNDHKPKVNMETKSKPADNGRYSKKDIDSITKAMIARSDFATRD